MVVDGLKVVDFDHGDREDVTVPTGTCRLADELRVEVSTLEEAGQRVLDALPLQERRLALELVEQRGNAAVGDLEMGVGVAARALGVQLAAGPLDVHLSGEALGASRDLALPGPAL